MPLLALIVLILSGAVFFAALALLIRGALYLPARPLNLAVVDRSDSPGDLFSLTLRRPGLARLLPLPRFAAGQSVTLAIPGEPVKRRYSIARWRKLPFAYELTIKRESQGRFSPRLADFAQRGARLVVGHPEGHFTLPERAAARRAVFIAGGVGITPLLAMLDQWVSERRPYPEIHLYWQVRHEQEALYRDALASLSQRQRQLRVRILVSRPSQGKAERIGSDLLQDELGALTDTDFYLCAGASLLDNLLAALINAGVTTTAMHYERFTLGAAAEGDEHWMIDFSGKRFAFGAHASLLDAIDSQRLVIDSDCRTGSCGRCLVAVEEGESTHRVTPEYAVPPRHVLACCSVPKSDLCLRAVVAGAAGTGA